MFVLNSWVRTELAIAYKSFCLDFENGKNNFFYFDDDELVYGYTSNYFKLPI